MKQTVEEAADECRIAIALSLDKSCFDIDECQDAGLSYDELVYNSFITGAKWQEKQSPWISVEERLPEEGQNVLVLIEYMGSMQINENTYWKTDKWPFGSETEVLAWMPIPSFDEILEANKDVLQRMKEKGD